jgi:hypothetical protein
VFIAYIVGCGERTMFGYIVVMPRHNDERFDRQFSTTTSRNCTALDET